MQIPPVPDQERFDYFATVGIPSVIGHSLLEDVAAVRQRGPFSGEVRSEAALTELVA